MAVGTQSFTVTRTLVLVSCYQCGTHFGLNRDQYDYCKKWKERVSFSCPACRCEQHFVGKTEAETLREELQRAYDYQSETRRELAAERKSHASTKGKVTKLRKRAQAGMCAECGRTFQNYARHMETKHSV